MNGARQTSRRRLLPTLLILAFGLTACGILDDGELGTVRRDGFSTGITETGELQAVSYTVVTCPSYSWNYGQATITYLEPEGTVVAAGDIVGMLDTAMVVKALREKETERAIAVADFNKLLADHANKKAAQEGQIRAAEGTLQRAVVDTQRVRFESDSRRRQSRLILQRAGLSLRKLRIQYDALLKTQSDERFIQETKIRRLDSDIEKAERTIETFTLRAPSDGMVEHRRNRREKSQVGDKVWPGRPILGLPDLSSMKVLTSVAETDIDKVFEGQHASVRLDAFPDELFDGVVTFVSLISHPKDRDDPSKVFDVELLLSETAPILKPGMTVSAEFRVADLEDVLVVPGRCLHGSEGDYRVVVSGVFGRKDVPVNVLYRNDREAAVEGDIEAGDRLVRR